MGLERFKGKGRVRGRESEREGTTERGRVKGRKGEREREWVRGSGRKRERKGRW